MNTTKVLFLVGAGLAVVVLVDMILNPGKRLLVLGGTREEFYGGSGRCFKTSDDSEVPVERCTERGVDVGASSGAITDALGGLAGGVGGFVGSVGEWFR